MKGVYIILLCFVVSVLGKQGFGDGDQDWGFVTVREKAHIFWWLYYTTANVASIEDKPLIIWLQGGPGSSSTGYGNFVELGPLDTDLNARDSNWVQYAHVLFVDNPVGAGFSYVEDESLLVTNNTQIAVDFLVFFKEFLRMNPVFQRIPIYIFTESYGGKMTAEITLNLIAEVQAGNIKCNLKGIALGDSWISPVDSVLNYAPFLYNMGIVDYRGYEKIQRIALQLQQAAQEERWAEAFGLWRGVEYEIKTNTYGVDMYNVLTQKQGISSLRKESIGINAVDPNADSKINDIMNNQVRQALNITQTWGAQSQDVFDVLSEDFMTPVVKIVEQLLNETSLVIAVYTGQLDLIVDTPGTISWVNNMNWNDKPEWVATTRVGFVENGFYQGYVKKAKNFAVYWVDRSGHMVPADNPSGMNYILKDVTNNFAV